MRNYIMRRLLLMIPVVWLVTIVVFFSVRLIPGDVIDVLLGDQLAFWTPAEIQAMKQQLGVDVPAHIQYVRWMGRLVKGDLGTSLYSRGVPVADRLMKAFPVSMELAVIAMIVAILLAIPIGIVSAVRQDTWADYAVRLISIGGLSIPNFVIATLIIVLPAMWWHWIPPMGFAPLTVDPWANLQQIFPAAFALGFRLSATSMRMVRSSLLEVLREDYVRTARAKGLRDQVVIYRHAVRNALIPVVTIWGNSFGYLLGGTVIIEQIFSLPGVGRIVIQSILVRDYTTLQGAALMMAMVFVLMNLITDLTYAFLDPRIRYS